MKLAHLADLHLGFRQYARTDAAGLNQRESDVAEACRRAFTDIIAQRPDLVLIAGDVFHSVRPPNGEILFLFRELQRVRLALPETRVVMVAGNHDTPRTLETGLILPLYSTLGIDVALLAPVRVAVPAFGCVVTAVPSAAAKQIPAPDPTATRNILVLHGDVPGYGAPAPAEAIDPDALQQQGWDYVALGHYHIAAEVKPRMWYSGALEFTSSDPWSEARAHAASGQGKGWLLTDLDAGTTVLRPVGQVRRFVDLPAIDATGMAAAELDLRIAQRVDEAAIDNAVARLMVTGMTRDLRQAIDYSVIRDYKARALHFQLDLRRSENELSPAAQAIRRRKLNDVVQTFLGERELPLDIDRAAFVQAGMQSFDENPYTGEKVA